MVRAMRKIDKVKPADDLLCFCAGVTRSELRAYLREPDASIGTFIEETGLARKCTACALDLDLIIDEELSTRSRIGEASRASQHEVGIAYRFLSYPERRIDSGFFLNRDGVRTTLRVGNYFPPFDDPRGIAEHHYSVQIFGPDGKRQKTVRGTIAKGKSLSLCFSDHASALEHGWFLLTLWATESAHAGTVRPQVTLAGPDWTTSYHTQFHRDAARKGRRCGVQLRTRDGVTRAGISIINASMKPTNFRLTAETQSSSQSTWRTLQKLGCEIIPIDEMFPELPGNESIIIRIESDEPTRKNVIFFGKDARVSVDHFPNLT